MSRALLLIAVVLAATLPLTGCSLPPSSRETSLAVQSTVEEAALIPKLETAVFIASDNNTADVYLTDLPPEVFTSPGSLRNTVGNVVHIHLFIVPKWGRTPVDSSACNFSVRHAVLAGGAAGLYAGGGFLFTGEPGGTRLSGTVRDATMRLTRADKAFADRLGVATISGVISARNDEALARAIAAKLERLATELPAVETGSQPGGAE